VASITSEGSPPNRRTEQFEVVIRNARVRGDAGDVCSVGISGGLIAAVETTPLNGSLEIDAGGDLVVAPFVDAHLHLDKVYTTDLVDDRSLNAYKSKSMGGSLEAIHLASRVKASLKEEAIYRNARRAILEGLRHGVTYVQAFVDTDTRARLEGINAVLRLRSEFEGTVKIRVVAFPQEGIVRDKGAEVWIRKALELGADVVGGIPWIESSDREAQRHVDIVLDLAAEYARPVAMLVDDAADPGLRTTEMLAIGALDRGIKGAVACHARAMSAYPEPYFRRFIELVREAGIAFVSDPHTGSAHLRVFDLVEAGIPVALGQDDIEDAYYQYGQHNMLEVAFLASHILNASTFAEMDTLLDLVTHAGRRVLGLPENHLRVGEPADLVVLHGSSVRNALKSHYPPRYVMSQGRIVVSSEIGTVFRTDLPDHVAGEVGI